jgi:uncharacterized delta-60 repeat protein
VKRRVPLALLALVPLVLVSGSQGAQGDVDPTFGSSGVVTTAFGEMALTSALAVDPAGRIIAAGSVELESAGPFEFGVARYESDGSLDSRFGSDGKSAARPSEALETGVSAVALQADGKIVVAGSSIYLAPSAKQVIGPGVRKSDASLIRFDPDGSVDTGFGTDGRVNEPRGSFSPDGHSYALSDILVQPDGKIVAVGSGDGRFLVVRYRSDGSLDDSFGSGGLAPAPAASVGASAYAVARQKDGKLVVAGSSSVYWDGTWWAERVILARYDANGALDRTFGDAGAISSILPGTDGYSLIAAASVLVQPDRKMVVGGSTGTRIPTGTGQFLLLRYNPDGSPDRAFGRKGIVRTPQASGGINALALQGDGRIVAAGDVWVSDPLSGSSVLRASVVRYNPDGSLDRFFDSPAYVLGVTDTVLQHDGKVIAASRAPRAAGQEGVMFALARFLASSTPCMVRDVRGLALASARAKITHAHCTLGRVAHAYSTKTPRGRIISQKPRPHTRLPVRAEVTLLLSRGRR